MTRRMLILVLYVIGSLCLFVGSVLALLDELAR
jgi:hypothetical protein